MYGSQTPFMVNALNNDANQVSDGLGMLVEQAAKSFEFWTGKQPESKKEIKKVRERIA
jgi:shikimate dehydrogenase